ncbi:hypothetical protein CTAM01_01184 [Colletotrichum tamarilloi]|uniref:Uncharacterized protein n=1 Tax=Colletotrichum tamarilloi TaxID=1209934 RepID=A0ABQ9RQG1_9PEZI|nr:uncharacterized protein CTAM01_01184 [Colletotrichum tamarilloi]KAK1510611.1 hypothetical protein CTAM01_01184 [Colletotrichum tamarilloi]
MDWLLDGSLLSNSETDLANVFEYEPRSVKVVQLDDEDGVRDLDQSYKPKITVVTSMAWDGDLALSVTHLSKTGSTNAIVFGTTAEIEDEIIDRLYCSSSALSHPFLLPGIFTELERERQLKRLVEDTQGELEKATYYLGSDEGSESDQAATQPIIDLWLNTTELRNGLFNWKTQVEEMLLHIEGMAESYSTSNVMDGRSAFACADTKADLKRKQAKVNSMIRNRLRSIINDCQSSKVLTGISHVRALVVDKAWNEKRPSADLTEVDKVLATVTTMEQMTVSKCNQTQNVCSCLILKASGHLCILHRVGSVSDHSTFY